VIQLSGPLDQRSPNSALFLLLEETTLKRIMLPLAELETVRHYRGVGRGGQLSNAFTQSVTPAGRDLMPYAPVHLRRASGAWGANNSAAPVTCARIGRRSQQVPAARGEAVVRDPAR
jgi:hypothetical protein